MRPRRRSSSTRSRSRQILINLVRNSIEAMRDCPTRTLLLTTAPGDVGFEDVTVQDSGPGLPPAVAAALFQPFLTTKDNGMGLGLMICQTLVEANGGHIALMADKIDGTGFRFHVAADGDRADSGRHLELLGHPPARLDTLFRAPTIRSREMSRPMPSCALRGIVATPSRDVASLALDANCPRTRHKVRFITKLRARTIILASGTLRISGQKPASSHAYVLFVQFD